MSQNIEHHIGGKFTGTITPDTLRWRNHERKEKKVTFIPVVRAAKPKD